MSNEEMGVSGKVDVEMAIATGICVILAVCITAAVFLPQIAHYFIH